MSLLRVLLHGEWSLRPWAVALEPGKSQMWSRGIPRDHTCQGHLEEDWLAVIFFTSVFSCYFLGGVGSFKVLEI